MPVEEESLHSQPDELDNNGDPGKELNERKNGHNTLGRSLSKKLTFQKKVPSHVFEALALQDRANPRKPVAACSNLTKEEEEEDEEASKLKDNLKGISLKLKTRPNLGKHPAQADCKQKKGSAKKKWPKVEIGLGSEHADLSVLLNGNLATPADLGSHNSPLQWREELKRVSCMNSISEGKRGVIGAELGLSDTNNDSSRRIVILKSGSSGVQEVFSGLIGERLGIRCPRIRVVEDSSEREAIEGSISDLLANDVYYQTNTLGYLQHSKQLLLMEAGTHRVTLDKLAEFNKTINIDIAFELGVMIPFDMIIANGDRLPLKGVWDRPGNAHNFLFPIEEKDYDSALLAIDQVCTHPRNKSLLDNYLAAIDDTLSSTESLRSALEVTVAFLGRASNTELVPGIEEVLLAGVREGVQRVARLDREDLVAVVNQVSEMGSTTAWYKNLNDNINLDVMCDIINICKNCTFNAVHFEYESGSLGLTRVLRSALQCEERQSQDILVFLDFDRTLTNGLASSGDLPLDRRVRGGEPTVKALSDATHARIPMYIITARSPRKCVLDQLVSSFRGPQRELASIFLREEKENHIDSEVITFQGYEIAFATRARFYATGYQKVLAMVHAISRKYPKLEDQESSRTSSTRKISVVFVDDVAMNANDVGQRAISLLRKIGRADLAERVTLRSVWWDTFLEDTGNHPTMSPEAGKTEQSYQDFMHALLLNFGISSAESVRRRAVYEAEEKASGRQKKEKIVQTPGKLKIDSVVGQQKLAAFLFGGGKATKERALE
mmetsp:Transcript_24702/g.25015  ORF Transcript_24702/g.25015 Transcript_24702/m.25015 type:complete len:780 (-) Transcript_24702:278-2617(-)